MDLHELGDTWADVTAGTPAGIGINWERCRYDRPQPGSVTATASGAPTRSAFAISPICGEIVFVHPQLAATVSRTVSRSPFCCQPRRDCGGG
jgi:hypothetical protein